MRHSLIALALLVLLASVCTAQLGLPRERSMFGPLIFDDAVLTGIQDVTADKTHLARLFAFDVATGRLRWQHEYRSAGMLRDVREGPAGTILLTKSRGGALVLARRDGKVLRELVPTQETAWRAIAVGSATLFCDGYSGVGASRRETVDAYDAKTLRKLWSYRLSGADWEVGWLRARGGRVEVAVYQRQTAPSTPPGASTPPVAAIVLGYHTLDAATGKLLAQNPNPQIPEGLPPRSMTLADGTKLHLSGGNIPGGGWYEEMGETSTRRIRWRTVFPGFRGSVLAPPLILVTYGVPEWRDDPRGYITHTRTLMCLDALTGAVKWQAPLEKGSITPPQPQSLAGAMAEEQARARRFAGGISRAQAQQRSMKWFVLGVTSGVPIIAILLVIIRLYRGSTSRID